MPADFYAVCTCVAGRGKTDGVSLTYSYTQTETHTLVPVSLDGVSWSGLLLDSCSDAR